MEHILNVSPCKNQEIVNNLNVWLIEFFVSYLNVVFSIVVGVVTVLSAE